MAKTSIDSEKLEAIKIVGKMKEGKRQLLELDYEDDEEDIMQVYKHVKY